MTTKIIDLLRDIADGKEVPEKIIYKNKCYYYKKIDKDYQSKDGLLFIANRKENLVNILNETVEIIEEPKKLEKIPDVGWFSTSARGNDTILKDKINEIIDKIKELENK